MAKDRFGFGTNNAHREEEHLRGMRGVSAQASMQSNTAPNPWANFMNEDEWHDPAESKSFAKDGKATKLPTPKPQMYKTLPEYERALVQYATLAYGLVDPKSHSKKLASNELSLQNVQKIARKNWSNMSKSQAGSFKSKAPDFAGINKALPSGSISRVLPDNSKKVKK